MYPSKSFRLAQPLMIRSFFPDRLPEADGFFIPGNPTSRWRCEEGEAAGVWNE
ncbi:MAG: hypothetical protein UU08_C0022G0010 [Candidatus Uhrbacteria bacterium GW2011_GWE2_40_58]|nr:MAG: hypothetical protein UT94_C0027G0010 [Candidatus Uhrbacteria bacterium GW2011_GWF2_40_263]KKR67259.1 MAG: hypothetical protein UU08_C0022G0010 [Candidatus Uhrbacteria bacterium GW2011_GWE2_40_58]